MFTVSAKIKEKNPNAFKNLKKRILELSSKKVVAGFPKGKLNNPHYENGASIIDVAIWNEFGTYNIPRRDFMGVATKAWQQYFTEQVDLYKEDLLSGKMPIDNFLKLMGEVGAELIKDAIVKLRTPANAPITIKGGWMRNKKTGKPFYVEGKKTTNPLVGGGDHSGDLSKAPIYELRRKDK